MPRFRLAETNSTIDLVIEELIIAGWAGREQAGIRQHIEELRALGVNPPSTTPLFYRVAGNLLTTAERIQVLGEASSGEVEVVLLGSPQGTLVGVGSDHTDREAEAWSVAHSKQVCAKPVGPELWRLEELRDHWDDLRLEAWATIDGDQVLYQQGAVSGLLPPDDLLRRLGLRDGQLSPGQAMLCGTLPVRGEVRPAGRLELRLTDPVRERRLDHAYTIQNLPVVS